jgi:hypothetical protein
VSARLMETSKYPGLTCESIARMSDREVEFLRRCDLPAMFKAAGIVVKDAEADVETLEDAEVALLAEIVRRCCQNRMNAYHTAQGRIGDWRDAI